jgi:allantoin racemase
VRIRYIIPGPMHSTRGHEELERREQLLNSWAAPDVDVDVVDTESGPDSIESAYEEYLSVPAAVEALLQAEVDGVDAVIVGCFDDPGVDAFREVATRTLVIGPGSAAMHTASLLGARFGIVTVPNPTSLKRLVLMERLDVRLVDVALVHTPVLELADDVDATVDAIRTVGRDLVSRGADTIVLGCMSMAFLDADVELADALGVPVVNPAKVALGVAEALVRASLLPSRLAYPIPPKLVMSPRSFWRRAREGRS